MGEGYGFPSSHSQWMGYFATFLTCHLFFRHRFTPFGFTLLDTLIRLVAYVGVLGWAAAVVYSRYVSVLMALKNQN
jgi:dolichyldiphosphatase